jgi:hypothetical protein
MLEGTLYVFDLKIELNLKKRDKKLMRRNKVYIIKE